MIPAPIPANETDRLDALRKLLVLDTTPEARFDRIVEFTASEFDLPIALISLVDADRQWFKAKFGLQVCETARDISFCGHAILSSEALIVEDATLDERFSDNPLVLGDPFIRFYAGIPLEAAGGERVGTLCIVDRKPRQLDPIDLAVLRSLAELAASELFGRPTRGTTC